MLCQRTRTDRASSFVLGWTRRSSSTSNRHPTKSWPSRGSSSTNVLLSVSILSFSHDKHTAFNECLFSQSSLKRGTWQMFFFLRLNLILKTAVCRSCRLTENKSEYPRNLTCVCVWEPGQRKITICVFVLVYLLLCIQWFQVIVAFLHHFGCIWVTSW